MLLITTAAAALLSACAGSRDPCHAPTEMEVRQGQIEGLLANCNAHAAAPPAQPAAKKESDR